MIITNEIYEYDIEHAGLTMYFISNLITEEEYKKLLSLPKKQRIIKTGLLEKDNPDWYETKTTLFDKYIKQFLKVNKIKSYQVNEIVLDAVWLSGVVPKTCVFDEHVVFRKKRHYNVLYIYEKRNIRFYLNTNTGEFDVRRGNLNKDSKLYRIFKNILQSYEYGNDVYEKLHKIRRKLKTNESYYGTELVSSLKNSTLINALIKEILKWQLSQLLLQGEVVICHKIFR